MFGNWEGEVRQLMSEKLRAEQKAILDAQLREQGREPDNGNGVLPRTVLRKHRSIIDLDFPSTTDTHTSAKSNGTNGINKLLHNTKTLPSFEPIQVLSTTHHAIAQPYKSSSTSSIITENTTFGSPVVSPRRGYGRALSEITRPVNEDEQHRRLMQREELTKSLEEQRREHEAKKLIEKLQQWDEEAEELKEMGFSAYGKGGNVGKPRPDIPADLVPYIQARNPKIIQGSRFGPPLYDRLATPVNTQNSNNNNNGSTIMPLNPAVNSTGVMSALRSPVMEKEHNKPFFNSNRDLSNPSNGGLTIVVNDPLQPNASSSSSSGGGLLSSSATAVQLAEVEAKLDRILRVMGPHTENNNGMPSMDTLRKHLHNEEDEDDNNSNNNDNIHSSDGSYSIPYKRKDNQGIEELTSIVRELLEEQRQLRETIAERSTSSVGINKSSNGKSGRSVSATRNRPTLRVPEDHYDNDDDQDEEYPGEPSIHSIPTGKLSKGKPNPRSKSASRVPPSSRRISDTPPVLEYDVPATRPPPRVAANGRAVASAPKRPAFGRHDEGKMTAAERRARGEERSRAAAQKNAAALEAFRLERLAAKEAQARERAAQKELKRQLPFNRLDVVRKGAEVFGGNDEDLLNAYQSASPDTRPVHLPPKRKVPVSPVEEVLISNKDRSLIGRQRNNNNNNTSPLTKNETVNTFPNNGRNKAKPSLVPTEPSNSHSYHPHQPHSPEILRKSPIIASPDALDKHMSNPRYHSHPIPRNSPGRTNKWQTENNPTPNPSSHSHDFYSPSILELSELAAESRLIFPSQQQYSSPPPRTDPSHPYPHPRPSSSHPGSSSVSTSPHSTGGGGGDSSVPSSVPHHHHLPVPSNPHEFRLHSASSSPPPVFNHGHTNQRAKKAGMRSGLPNVIRRQGGRTSSAGPSRSSSAGRTMNNHSRGGDSLDHLMMDTNNNNHHNFENSSTGSGTHVPSGGSSATHSRGNSQQEGRKSSSSATTATQQHRGGILSLLNENKNASPP